MNQYDIGYSMGYEVGYGQGYEYGRKREREDSRTRESPKRIDSYDIGYEHGYSNGYDDAKTVLWGDIKDQLENRLTEAEFLVWVRERVSEHE